MFNVSKPPFDNRDARLAAIYAIDRSSSPTRSGTWG